MVKDTTPVRLLLPQELAQDLSLFSILVLLDGHGKALIEMVGTPQVSWIEEVKEVPQLAVFPVCARGQALTDFGDALGLLFQVTDDLLECAGVDTVPELAQRNAANLFAKLTEVNEEKNLVRKLPTESQVEGWVTEAGTLERVVTH